MDWNLDHSSLEVNNLTTLKVYVVRLNDETDHGKVDLDVVKIVCLTSRLE